MSEEFENFSEKYKRDHYRSIVGNGKSLQDQLKEKEEIIENYDLQFKKLYEDFNYNVDLIFERDRDIESLNKKVEELSILLSSKDEEIYDLKQKNIRLKQLENENSILIKKIESLTAGKPEREKFEKRIPKVELKPPRLDYKNLLKDNKKAISKRIQDLSNTQAKNSFGYMESSIECSETPFADLNFDLESRIKALEIENTAKEKKCSSLSISRLSEKTEDMDSDISGAREKVKKQEKEISELIKSLQTYKKQTELPSKMKIRTYDDQILALNEDIERLRNGENQLLSHPSEPEENERKYIPIIWPRSTYIKRFN